MFVDIQTTRSKHLNFGLRKCAPLCYFYQQNQAKWVQNATHAASLRGGFFSTNS